MTLNELIGNVGTVKPALLAVAYGTPLALWGAGRLIPDAKSRPAFGHVASGLVAAGFIVSVLGALGWFWARGRGTALGDVELVALVAPFFFGLGNLLAATRTLSFEELKRYPLLRRVWAMLLAAALLLVVVLILKRTYLIVFTGIFGFIVVAIVVWTLFQKLVSRVTDSDPSADLLDDVAAESHRRVGRFAGRLARPRSKNKGPR